MVIENVPARSETTVWGHGKGHKGFPVDTKAIVELNVPARFEIAMWGHDKRVKVSLAKARKNRWRRKTSVRFDDAVVDNWEDKGLIVSRPTACIHLSVTGDRHVWAKTDIRAGLSSGRLERIQRPLSFRITPEGKDELRSMIEAQAKQHAPVAKHHHNGGVSLFEYTKETQASSLCNIGCRDQWCEIELTADTVACDTVIPRDLCPGIPMEPSMPSIAGMECEAASGQSIPNLGERRCEMWTDGASQGKLLSMQFADVHKALLGLSWCADMEFEFRFGSPWDVQLANRQER